MLNAWTEPLNTTVPLSNSVIFPNSAFIHLFKSSIHIKHTDAERINQNRVQTTVTSQSRSVIRELHLAFIKSNIQQRHFHFFRVKTPQTCLLRSRWPCFRQWGRTLAPSNQRCRSSRRPAFALWMANQRSQCGWCFANRFFLTSPPPLLRLIQPW